MSREQQGSVMGAKGKLRFGRILKAIGDFPLKEPLPPDLYTKAKRRVTNTGSAPRTAQR